MVTKLKTRIQHKHDIPANWAKATFVPLAGELIIYDDHYFDADGNKIVVADTIKYKLGDGVTPVYDLPFVESVDLVSDQTIGGEKTFLNKIALSDKDGAKKYIAFDSTDLTVSEKVTVSGITGTFGETFNNGDLPVTYYTASIENTTDKPIKRIEVDSTLHTVLYTPGETAYKVILKSTEPSDSVKTTLTITYDGEGYILPDKAGTLATQEWTDEQITTNIDELALVAKSGAVEDLSIDALTTLVLDGGCADINVAILDKTILL